jgi:hypothetical protein
MMTTSAPNSSVRFSVLLDGQSPSVVRQRFDVLFGSPFEPAEQGLKPEPLIPALSGTTEVVPCYKTKATKSLTPYTSVSSGMDVDEEGNTPVVATKYDRLSHILHRTAALRNNAVHSVEAGWRNG